MSAILRKAGASIAGDAPDIVSLVEIVRETSPDIVLHEAHRDEMDDLLELLKLGLGSRGSRILILAERAEATDVRAALRAGASAFLLRTVRPEGLISAVEWVATGGTVIDPYLLTAFVSDLGISDFGPTDFGLDVLGKLTSRDIAIIGSMVDGKTSRAIAAELNLTPGAIRNRLTHIYRVLGVHDRASAAAIAIRSGIVR